MRSVFAISIGILLSSPCLAQEAVRRVRPVEAMTRPAPSVVTQTPTAELPPVSQPCPAVRTSDTTFGFDEKLGEPYAETPRADGTVQREYSAGTQILRDGQQTEWIPRRRLQAISGQAPTPPQLPEDPRQGRHWLEAHNKALDDIIEHYLKDNASARKVLDAREAAVAGGDLFKQIEFRTHVASFYASGR
jgi:hypothetical protein